MNILIVESKNDQYFIEALAIKISSTNRICSIDEFKHSNLDESKLQKEIKGVLLDIASREGAKIGIILDMDNSSEEGRIVLVNRCLKGALLELDYSVPDKLIRNVSEFIKIPIDEYLVVQVACFFTNIDGEGELEDILKAIKSQNSDFADCLYAGWKDCLEKKGKKVVGSGEKGDISKKELLKLWVDFYKRFDTLSKKQRKQAEKNTDWEGIMLGINGKKARGEEIFDLNSEKLTDIKSFLKLFD